MGNLTRWALRVVVLDLKDLIRELEAVFAPELPNHTGGLKRQKHVLRTRRKRNPGRLGVVPDAIENGKEGTRGVATVHSAVVASVLAEVNNLIRIVGNGLDLIRLVVESTTDGGRALVGVRLQIENEKFLGGLGDKVNLQNTKREKIGKTGKGTCSANMRPRAFTETQHALPHLLPYSLECQCLRRTGTYRMGSIQPVSLPIRKYQNPDYQRD